MEAAVVQRRTLRLLFVTQIISGVGVAVGASVGALLAAELAGGRCCCQHRLGKSPEPIRWPGLNQLLLLLSPTPVLLRR
jgi:hypothetical protein